jgi:DNA-binding NtrC family response regulator
MGREVTRAQPKVLMIGARRQVLDNVRVLLTSMECRCVIGSSFKEALLLLEKDNPDAAVFDAHGLVSWPWTGGPEITRARSGSYM